jgi:hypothetical protein
MTDVFDHEALNQPGDRSDTNTAAGRMVFSMVSAMAERDFRKDESGHGGGASARARRKPLRLRASD